MLLNVWNGLNSWLESQSDFLSLMDAIRFKTGSGTIQDGLSTWFNKTDSETLQDAERRWLLAFPATTSGTNQDLWMQYLNSLGYPGALCEKQLQYWNAQVDP